MRVLVICPCGATFDTIPSRIKAGRGSFCSKTCFYKYRRPRPCGLKYEIKVENRAWFRTDSPRATGDEHPAWRGGDVSYKRLHRWVREHREKPDSCEWCKATGPLDWANLSHEYGRDLNDWVALCRKCHRNHDKGDARGAATRKYGEKAVQRG